MSTDRQSFAYLATAAVAGGLFGIGWGLAGICPGPAISLIAFMPQNLLVFLVAMFAGSFAGGFVLKWTARRPAIA